MTQERTIISWKGRFRRKRSLLVLILISLLFTAWFYDVVLFCPNSYLLNNRGDAIKNYYCYAWHIQHDISFINYTGTNYPFGENHLYTDGTPLLANLIKCLPFLKPYAIGIFNLSMLLSLTLCSVLLYNIFRLARVRELFSVLAALGIMILCPQALRYEGHFALSYGFCIPLIIYLLMLYELNKEKRFRLSILTGFSVLCILFIHPYLGMICNAFVIFYWFVKLVAERKTLRSFLFPFLVQALFPFICYYVFLKLTDHHTGRVARPYGFHYFLASIESVFISTHKPFRHLLSQLYPIKEQNGEGIAYVGITTLMCLLGLPYLVYKKRTEISTLFKSSHMLKSYAYMGVAAFALLLFAMGYPFKWHMDWLLDYMPAVEQFRSPGRFAWVFYFVATIGTVVIIDRYFIPKANNTLRTCLISLLLLLFAVEGIPYHMDMHKRHFPENQFKYGNLETETKEIVELLKTQKPQAIIPLPFFHYGTDFYNIVGSVYISNASLLMSYHSGIPVMASLTPRNSLTEAEQLIQVISNDVIEKEIGSKVNAHKPFIIICHKEWLGEEEQALLAKAEPLLETAHYLVKKISHEALFHNSSPEKLEELEANKHTYIPYEDFLLSDTSYFIHKEFDELPGQVFTGNENEENVLLKTMRHKLQKDVVYELSFWYHTRDRLDNNNELVVREIQDEKKELARQNMMDMPNLQHGKTLATLSFKTEHPGKAIEVCLLGKSDREKVFYVDKLMIREKRVNVYKRVYSENYKDSTWTFNNMELVPCRYCGQPTGGEAISH
jgi:hypothetical protein